MIENPPTWIGREIDGYLIEKLLSDGQFASVCLGRDLKHNDFAVLKIAKDVQFSQQGTSEYRTRAYTIAEGLVASVHPDPTEVLVAEMHRINDSAGCRYIHAGGFSSKNGVSSYLMAYESAPTLRDCLVRGQRVGWEFFVDLTNQLEKIRKRDTALYHGDLKPEHILITQQGALLIDPGCFEPFNCREGAALDCVVTTPLYYPFLRPDDLYAFGVLFWETICKQHPFLPNAIAPNGETAVDESIHAWVRSYENVGQYFLSPILQLQRPTKIHPDMPPQLEQVLLRGLRLQVGEGGLMERGPGFEDFTQWRDALLDLDKQGIHL